MLSGSASYVPLTPEICVIILGDRVRIICELHVLITTVDHRIKLKRLSELRNELGRWDFSNRWIGWIFETFARVDEDDFLPLFVSWAAQERIIISQSSSRDQVPVIILVVLVIWCDLQHIDAWIINRVEDREGSNEHWNDIRPIISWDNTEHSGVIESDTVLRNVVACRFKFVLVDVEGCCMFFVYCVE